MATIEETSGSATLNNNNKHFGDDGLDKLESHEDALSSHSSAGSSNNVNVDDSGNNSLATDGTNDDAPEVELIIRASTIDGRRKGACIFCQEYFMDLYLLAELKTISLKVTTVDMLKPPPDFRSRFDCTMPPILIDHGEAILENEKIERHIMKSIPGGHNLFVSDKETANVIENIYTKFKLMITRNDAASKNNFLNQLRKINTHMAKRDSRFLTGDALVCFDCELMTRLQHIRVAGKYFCEFDIPEELYHIWRYMYHMYQLDAFTESCPADQDIINQYKLQQRTKMTKHEELEEPTSANTIPEVVYKKIVVEERERGVAPDHDADEMHAQDDE